jgi:putative membrane protein (TIGR04086 family)
MKTNNNQDVIINFIISVFFYLLIGLLYSNHFHKKGLIIGILASFIHLFVFKLILLVFKQEPSFNILLIVIYSVCGGIGGFLGILFKKII